MFDVGCDNDFNSYGDDQVVNVIGFEKVEDFISVVFDRGAMVVATYQGQIQFFTVHFLESLMEVLGMGSGVKISWKIFHPVLRYMKL